MLVELEVMARRLEQQLVSYEKLHADEMKRFEEELQTLQRIQTDELAMLRNELEQLKQEISVLKEEEAERAADKPSQTEPAQLGRTLTRRDFLTGKIPSLTPR